MENPNTNSQISCCHQFLWCCCTYKLWIWLGF